MESAKFLKTLAVMAASFAVAAMLSGCITVNVPAEEPSAAATSSTPAATSTATSPATQGSEPAPEPEPSEASEPSQEPAQTQQEQEPELSQEVDFSISGGCLDSYDILGYYGIFEEYDDNCVLVVQVFPAEPRRFAELQYFDGTWVMEDSMTTDSQGVARLIVDTYCDDGYWCEGVWDYRVVVDAYDTLPAERSPEFELEFLPWY